MTANQTTLYAIQGTFLLLVVVSMVLFAARTGMNKLLKVVRQKNLQELGPDRVGEAVSRTVEAKRYALSVNASLSCLENELREAASPQNMHTCER